jgi:hypothetical protein
MSGWHGRVGRPEVCKSPKVVTILPGRVTRQRSVARSGASSDSPFADNVSPLVTRSTPPPAESAQIIPSDEPCTLIISALRRALVFLTQQRVIDSYSE